MFEGSGRVYGKIKVNGVDTSTHRLAWELEYGPIPDGLQVLHHCDQPRCVRPDHLFLGTQRDNMLDMYSKGHGHKKRPGESPRGSSHWAAKLTEEQVIEARQLYETGEFYFKDLANHYGVTKSTIHGAIREHTWSHLRASARAVDA